MSVFGGFAAGVEAKMSVSRGFAVGVGVEMSVSGGFVAGVGDEMSVCGGGTGCCCGDEAVERLVVVCMELEDTKMACVTWLKSVRLGNKKMINI